MKIISIIFAIVLFSGILGVSESFAQECKTEHVLIFKVSKNTPACVKPATAEKLVERGWGMMPEEPFSDYPDSCNAEPDPGLCKAAFTKFYFNSETSTCEQFIWGGCGGVVPFDSLSSCQAQCEPEVISRPDNVLNGNDVVDANNQFAIDYFKQINKDKNVFFSPWSITSAFAIVNEGAKGNTSFEIQNVFGFDDDTREDFRAINKILNQEHPGYTIEVANSLWIAQDLTLHSNYAETVETYYDGVIGQVDFANDGTETINGWVSNKTREKIPELFNPPLDPNTRLVVANAIYFNGTWSAPFDEKRTTDDKFITSPGRDVTVPFMKKDYYYNHTEIEDFQIIELPYEGNDASMLIFLPTRIDGLESLVSQLSSENLKIWTSDMKESRLYLQMPKFSLETEYNLVKDLMALGINDAFGPADFSGISSEGLFITRAIHKAFVDVNEKGTEAAAATGIEMFASAPPHFRADHPFIFLIQEKTTGNILFIGKVMDPS